MNICFSLRHISAPRWVVMCTPPLGGCEARNGAAPLQAVVLVYDIRCFGSGPTQRKGSIKTIQPDSLPQSTDDHRVDSQRCAASLISHDSCVVPDSGLFTFFTSALRLQVTHFRLTSLSASKLLHRAAQHIRSIIASLGSDAARSVNDGNVRSRQGKWMAV